jgi:sugar phosphate isomerase/epimerase
MKISTEFSSSAKIVGEERAVELIGKAGFEAWDLSLYRMLKYDSATGRRYVDKTHPLSGSDYLKHVRKLRRIGEDNGIVCNQAHAPFSSKDPEISSTFKRAIECAAEAGAPNIVFHTMTSQSMDANIGLFSAILPFAKECGVKIAVENTYLWPSGQQFAGPAPVSTPETMLEFLNRINDDDLVSCIDIGHAEISSVGTNAVDMIRAAGKKLACLHVQDCDHIHDSHALPFTMNIDFDAVIKALREVDYKGDMTLEADSFIYFGYKDRPDEILDGLRIMRDTANRLREMFFKEN